MHVGEVQASSGLLQDKPRARPAARASTAMLQDKLLKHRARPAARASTGMHRSRHAARACQPGLFDSRRANQMVVVWRFFTMARGAQSATTAGEPKKQL